MFGRRFSITYPNKIQPLNQYPSTLWSYDGDLCKSFCLLAFKTVVNRQRLNSNNHIEESEKALY